MNTCLQCKHIALKAYPVLWPEGHAKCGAVIDELVCDFLAIRRCANFDAADQEIVASRQRWAAENVK